MAKYWKKCLGIEEEPCASREGFVYNVPLMGYAHDGTQVSPAASWGYGMQTVMPQPGTQAMIVDGQGMPAPSEASLETGMPGPSAAQALQGVDLEYDAIYDWKSGGMWVDAPCYKTSYFIQGIKCYEEKEPHRLCIITSTGTSTRRGEFEKGMPYLSFEVWVSGKDGHTASGGQGMEITPGDMNSCYPAGTVAQYFKVEKGLQDIGSLEQLLAEVGIKKYIRFLCGYHIHGAAAVMYDPRLCALDWYSQTSEQRISQPSKWNHYLILDQAS